MQGSCLCGQVRYHVTQLKTKIVHCHCNTCQKAHAAAYNTTAGVAPEHVKWLQGEHLLTGFESSPGKVRYFCSKCGTHLIAKKQGAPHWVLRVATLDDEPNQLASSSIWCAHKRPWLQNNPDLIQFDEWEK